MAIIRMPQYEGPTAQIGRLLGTGLESLAQKKIQAAHQQRQGDVYQQLGFPREVSQLSPEQQKLVIPELMKRIQGETEQQQLQSFLERLQTGAPAEPGVTPEGGVAAPVSRAIATGEVPPALAKKVAPFAAAERGLANLELKQQELAQKASIDERDYIDKFLDPISEKSREASAVTNQNNLLRDLQDTGELKQGLGVDIAQRAGLPLSLVANSMTELADKLLEENIVKRAGAMKGRPSAQLLKLMRKSSPTLAQTPNGFRAILDAQDALFADPDKVLYDMGVKVLEEYQGQGKPIGFKYKSEVKRRAQEETDKRIKVASKNILSLFNETRKTVASLAELDKPTGNKASLALHPSTNEKLMYNPQSGAWEPYVQEKWNLIRGI